MYEEWMASELACGESAEFEPGVVVERRSFLTTAAVAFAALGGGSMARAARLDPRRDEFDYADFLAEALPVAKALVADGSRAGQDRYLFALAAIAVRLGDAPQPSMRSSGEGTFIGANEGGDPFVVLHWRMATGSRVGVHPHIYGNVVTLGLEGEARIENYEVVGQRDYDSTEPFTARRTLTQWLTPGGVNLVNLDRNYMHGFVAGPNGARGLDITTKIREKRSTPNFELVRVLDASADTFEARWRTA